MKFDFLTNALCFFAVTAGMAVAASSHSAHAQQCCQTASTCTGTPLTSQSIQEPERVDGHVSDSTLASALTEAATFYKDSASRSEGITLATGGCDSAFSDRTCAVEQEALSHFTITDVKITRYDGTEGMQCSSDSDCSCALPAVAAVPASPAVAAVQALTTATGASLATAEEKASENARRVNPMIEEGPESAPVAALNGGAALSRSAGASAAEHFRAAAAGGAAGAAAASAGSGLQGVRLVAAPRYEDKALTAAALSSVDHLRGAPLDAGTLQQALESFTDFYRNKGYTLSQAYLPAQSIVDGWVDLAVVNPKYNNFNLENVSYVSDDYMKYLMTDVYELEGKDIVEGELDERLLKLSDIGTFNIAGQIDNSDAAGLYRDVDFQAAPDGDQVNFAVFADNYGNKSAGRYRFGGLMEVISPAGMADRLSVVYARSNEKQNNYSINYRIPVNSHPTVVGLDLCYSDYELAGMYRELGAQGHSLSAEAYFIEPLLRSYDHKLSLTGGITYRDITDEYSVFDLSFEKHSWGAFMGWESFLRFNDNTGITADGRLNLTRIYSDDEFEVTRERTYTRLEGKASLWHRPEEQWLLSSTVRFQMASDNVDSSDIFLAGGDEGLRAFEYGDISGDGGLIWTNAVTLMPDGLENTAITAHIETGRVYTHGYEGENATSAGVTLNWSGYGINAELDLSQAIGTAPIFAQNDAAARFRVSYSF